VPSFTLRRPRVGRGDRSRARGDRDQPPAASERRGQLGCAERPAAARPAAPEGSSRDSEVRVRRRPRAGPTAQDPPPEHADMGSTREPGISGDFDVTKPPILVYVRRAARSSSARSSGSSARRRPRRRCHGATYGSFPPPVTTTTGSFIRRVAGPVCSDRTRPRLGVLLLAPAARDHARLASGTRTRTGLYN